VSDLRITRTFGNAVGIIFTTTDDGYGNPARYDVRYAPAPMSWSSARSVTLGPCATPLAGESEGSGQFCAILGLATGTDYEFQMVAYRGTLNQDAVFGQLSNVAAAQTTTQPFAVATPTIGVGHVTQTTVEIGFSDVSQASGQPVAYEVRYAREPISWGSATVATGSCSNVTGKVDSNGLIQGGQVLRCTISGLQPYTMYNFQAVAYRGTLNENAAFSALSNVIRVQTPS
jgi:hypothetical protein